MKGEKIFSVEKKNKEFYNKCVNTEITFILKGC